MGRCRTPPALGEYLTVIIIVRNKFHGPLLEQVFGPILHEVSSPKALNESMRIFYNTVFGKVPLPKEFHQTGSWADVRDIARAHVQALQVQEASGKRFILSAGEFAWQDWCAY